MAWKARLGSRENRLPSTHDVLGLAESPPGWTMTPLFKETEKVKETCARIALENAALTSLIPQIRGENEKLKAELTALEEKLGEEAVLRERDTFYIKAEQETLARHAQDAKKEWTDKLESVVSQAAEQRLKDDAAHAEARRALETKLDALKATQAEHEEARCAMGAKGDAALADLEARSEAARGALRDEYTAHHESAREQAEREASSVAQRFEQGQVELAALRAHVETRCDALAQAIEDAADGSKRALEALSSKLNSTLLRLDRQQREARTAFEDYQTESAAKLSEAQEARAQMETKVILLESRMEQLERSMAAAAQ